jgi:hypothetical protein
MMANHVIIPLPPTPPFLLSFHSTAPPDRTDGPASNKGCPKARTRASTHAREHARTGGTADDGASCLLDEQPIVHFATYYLIDHTFLRMMTGSREYHLVLARILTFKQLLCLLNYF